MRHQASTRVETGYLCRCKGHVRAPWWMRSTLEFWRQLQYWKSSEVFSLLTGLLHCVSL